MFQLILVIITLVEFWLLFTICYALAKRDSDGKRIISKKLTFYAIILFGMTYFLINIFFLI